MWWLSTTVTPVPGDLTLSQSSAGNALTWYTRRQNTHRHHHVYINVGVIYLDTHLSPSHLISLETLPEMLGGRFPHLGAW